MSDLQRLLHDAVTRDRLVGAQLAVLKEGVCVSACAGTRVSGSSAPVTSGTAFEIGSVTKPLVAAALLLAQARGDVDLDAPVGARVPEFQPRDPSAAQITGRQLLSHTSGLAGDFFPDTGSGPGALAAYVELLAAQPLDVAPGRTVSYSNGAYVLAGRLLECVSGTTFSDALAGWLLRPAGAHRVGTWSAPGTDDLMRGHAPGPDGEPVPTTRRYPDALTPAGGLLAPALDLAALVRALTVTPEGGLPDWLPTRSRERLAALADRPGTSLGWGWAVVTSAGETLLAHDGGTFGASSFVRVLPERDVVVVLLTGRSGVGAAGHALVDAAMQEVGAPPVTPQAPGDVPGAVREPAAVPGRYHRTGGVVEVRQQEPDLWCVVTTESQGGGTRQEGPLRLQPTGAWVLPAQDGPLTLVFLGSAHSADCVVVGARAHTRTSDDGASATFAAGLR